MLRILSSVFLAFTFAACAQAHDHGDPGGESATDYYRPGHVIPATVDLSRDDVPRDDYGRPFTYEGLGEKLPPLAATMVDGASFTTDQLAGKWTVIEIWGIWCHDSRNDAPYAAALSTALEQDPDVSFMSIHTPQNAGRADKALRGYESVPAWFEEKGWSFPTVFDADASLREQLRIGWTPTYLVVAPDLTVQGFRTGLADAGDHAVKDFVQAINATRRDWAAE